MMVAEKNDVFRVDMADVSNVSLIVYMLYSFTIYNGHVYITTSGIEKETDLIFTMLYW